MAREGLMLPLRDALRRAKRENAVVRKENVRVKASDRPHRVNLEVIPIKNVEAWCYLVLFNEIGPEDHRVGKRGSRRPGDKSVGAGEAPPRRGMAGRLRESERQLTESREYLQSTQERYEAALEELQASNEEISSANEELQSINEELETSKEELESGNEELTTLNDELARRNVELSRLNGDLNNLFDGVRTPILLLGRDLTIRRFTPQAETVFNLVGSDVGRPLRNLRHNLEFPELEPFLAGIVDSLREDEREVRDRSGRWYSLRARPYLTPENRVDGALLMLVDITALKESGQRVAEARDFAQAIVGSVPPLLILGGDLRVQAANESFYQAFRVTSAQTEHRLIYELGDGQWDIPGLRTLLEEILPKDNQFLQYEVTHEFEAIGRRTVLLSGRRVQNRQSIILSIDDITERKKVEESLRQAKEGLAQYTSQLEEFSHTLAHDLRAPLRAMQSFAGLLEEQIVVRQNAQMSEWSRRIRVAAARLDELVKDSLNYSKILRQDLPTRPVDVAELLQGILETYPNLQAPAVEVQVQLDQVVVQANPGALTQVLTNLLGNAVKFVRPGTKPCLRVWAESVRGKERKANDPGSPGLEADTSVPAPRSGPSMVRIWVEDNGIGVPGSAQRKIFDMFFRLHPENDYPGTGVGLAIVRQAVKRMGGQVGLESEPGKGSRFWFDLPKGHP
jgi:two-component system CheB/CheR fusion protein